jgi:hypothetical protein
LVIGAGRIGAGFNWHDDEYSHAGAYRALSDRVELVGFVEPDLERRVKANLKWGVPTYDNVAIALEALKPDIVSICTQPDQAPAVVKILEDYPIKGVWAEKPYYAWKPECIPVQVNYMRRGDEAHRYLASVAREVISRLVVYGKDDIHTRCHFEDLAAWWDCPLDYRPFNGPCAYIVLGAGVRFFDNGGVDGGTCFKAMLGNLLDHVDNGTPLWSSAR